MELKDFREAVVEDTPKKFD